MVLSLYQITTIIVLLVARGVSKSDTEVNIINKVDFQMLRVGGRDLKV